MVKIGCLLAAASVPASMAALALSSVMYHTVARMSEIANHLGRRSNHGELEYMRAAFIEQTGPPEVIKVGELPRPAPGPGQVLLRVHAVALNPIDLYIRSGLVAMPLSFPYIIGCDVAGTVEEIGTGLHAVSQRGSRLGLKPGAARPSGSRGGIRRRR